MPEQHRDTDRGNRRAAEKRGGELVTQKYPAQYRIRHHQQRKQHRDQAGSDEQFGIVNKVEIEGELEKAEDQRQQITGSVEPERQALECCQGEHRGGGNYESIADRPARRHFGNLVLDHQPGRSPDQRDQQERDQYAGGEQADFSAVFGAHSAAIASASGRISSALWFQLVTSRACPAPQS